MDFLKLFRVKACVPEVKLGNPIQNTDSIINFSKSSYEEGVDCIVFPELSMTGYTNGDLFQQELLMTAAEEGISKIAQELKEYPILIAVGAPVEIRCNRYNCAVLIYRGEIVAVIPKSYLPNYGEFYEKRWFESGKDIKDTYINFGGHEKVPFGTDIIVEIKGVKIGVEICEDLWVPNPPSSSLAMAGAEVILNLSASDEIIGKHDYLVSLISQQSARCRCAYVYSSAGWGESSTDLVFIGKAMVGIDGVVYGAKNKFLTYSFSEVQDIDIEKLKQDRLKFNTFVDSMNLSSHYRYIKPALKDNPQLKKPFKELLVNPLPFVPSNPEKLNHRCEEIINIQSYGLMRRLSAIGCKKAVIGISGGLDSTLALLVTVKAFDNLKISRKGIIAITMPGLATSSRTKNNAWELMKNLGVTYQEIPIHKAIEIHFKDIDQNPLEYNATYENSQARERTQILMDLANKENGIVIGTGDMSELALGWCTYNGDQMSMYGVNASIPKTLVKHLVGWFASNTDSDIAIILKDICDTPISPELVPSESDDIAQKTEDLVGPYELHDFYLFYFLRYGFSPIKIFELAKIAFKNKYDESIILKWLKVFFKRFFTQQFKRSSMPDGPKVGSVNLSPRGDWRMPSDVSVNLWLNQLNQIEETHEN